VGSFPAGRRVGHDSSRDGHDSSRDDSEKYFDHKNTITMLNIPGRIFFCKPDSLKIMMFIMKKKPESGNALKCSGVEKNMDKIQFNMVSDGTLINTHAWKANIFIS
jgi:hypothetical protein